MTDPEKWDDSHELLIKSLAEQAQVSAVLHRRAYEYFEHRNIRYQLPIIILSVFSGSANFISSSFPEVQKHIVIGVGALSILTSIISSISQYLKLAESSEGHRIAAYAWDKLYSRLNIHLGMKREDRDVPMDFINVAQTDYLRLVEMSPDVPPTISHEVKSRHKRTLSSVQSPVVVSGFKPVSIYGTEIDVDAIPYPIDMTPTRHMSIASPPPTPSISSKC
jgi:hypothetical protein